MGGRGGSSGIKQKYTNNVITFTGGSSGSESSFDGGAKWHYPENDKRIAQLSSGLANARSASKINAVAKAARNLDRILTAEINRVQSGVEPHGDLNALITQRRKVRQLMQRARF